MRGGKLNSRRGMFGSRLALFRFAPFPSKKRTPGPSKLLGPTKGDQAAPVTQ